MLLIMDKHETQRKIFSINAVLILLSVLALIAIIPRLLQEANQGRLPHEAAFATSVGIGLHVLILMVFLFGIRLARLKRRINREINLVSAIVLIPLGLIISDGAFAYIDSYIYLSIGLFLCVLGDLAAGVVSIVALVKLREKKST